MTHYSTFLLLAALRLFIIAFEIFQAERGEIPLISQQMVGEPKTDSLAHEADAMDTTHLFRLLKQRRGFSTQQQKTCSRQTPEDRFSTRTSTDSVHEVWVARYNGRANSADRANAIDIDAVGNIYVTGWSYEVGTGDDYVTIRYNSSGIEEWIARYNGPGNDEDIPRAIAVDASGNVYVTGWSHGLGSIFDYSTVKYSSTGIEQWVARYNGLGNSEDRAASIVVDDSGNVYVTGRSLGSGTGLDYATIKYDSSGNEAWVARHNGSGNDYDVATDLVIDSLGNVYVTGSSSDSLLRTGYSTIKYNSSGLEEWVATFNGSGNFIFDYDFPTAIAIDEGRNIFVTGWSWGDSSHQDYTTIKYNNSGVEQWIAHYNGPGNVSDGAFALTLDAYSNVYVTGGSGGVDSTFGYATVKYDSSGVELWVARYDNPAGLMGYGYALANDDIGNVYVTGRDEGPGSLNDFLTIKYNSSGLEQWRVRYNGPANAEDYPMAIAVDTSGFVYVAGWSGGTNWDFATIKYAQDITSAFEGGSALPGEYWLHQNYPNPFNPNTNIVYRVASRELVSLKIFNVLGQEVATLVNEVKQAGRHEVTWDAVGLPSGLYFYRLQAGEFISTKKLLLLK